MLKKTILLLLFIQPIFGQNAFNFQAGYAINTSGGAKGYNLGFGFEKGLKKNMALEFSLMSYIHKHRVENEYETDFSSGVYAKAPFRIGLNSLQLEVLPKLYLVNKKMKVAVLFGGLLVKETSLSPETYRVDYPISIIAPYPIPIHIIDYNNKLVSWHLGYNAQIELGLEISKNRLLVCK